MKRIHFVIILFFFSLITSEELNSVFLFMPVFVIAGYKLNLIDNMSFTPDDMLWLCIIIFFGVAPMQILEKGMFVGSGSTTGLTYTNNEIVQALTCLYLFLCFFIYGSYVCKEKNYDLSIKEKSGEITIKGISFCAIIMLFCSIMYVLTAGGFSNILSPRLDKIEENSSFISVLFLAFLVGCNCILSIDMINRKDRRGITFPLVFLSVLILAFFVNFLNSPRFFIVASWLPVILVYINKKLKFITVYAGLMFGVFFIMPIMSVTTRVGFSDLSVKDIFSTGIFKIKDVDVFETMVHTIGFVKMYGYGMGDNILAIVLFFVPRSFWPGKPIVGGLNIGNDLFWGGVTGTPNLSYFIASDLFMDFGMVGVVIGGLLIGGLYGRITNSRFNIGGHKLLNYSLISTLPILLRGPVGAVIGYPLCIIASFIILKYVIRENENTTYIINH